MKISFITHPPDSREGQRLMQGRGCQSPIMAMTSEGFFAVFNKDYNEGNGAFFAVGPDGVTHYAKSHEDAGHHNTDTDSALFRGLVMHIGKVYGKPLPNGGQLYLHWKDGGGGLSHHSYIYNRPLKEWQNVNLT